MSANTVVRFAGRLLIAASTIGLIACGGDAAGPEAPNPLGVPDTVVFAFSSPEVVIGDTLRLSVVARDAGGNVVPNVVLIWRSLTPSVATVSADGLVTALDIGEAEIEVEATIPGSSMALMVDSSQIGATSLRKVKTKFKMYSIPKVVIIPGAATINVKEAQLFQARITNLNDIELRNRPETKWSSSNPAVATIDAAGIATAVTKGTTTITATVTVGASSSVRKTATLTVSEPLCGGIALIETLKGGPFFYDYAVGGTIGDSRVAAEYHGQVTATMTNTGWEPGKNLVLWFGPLAGTASQVETVHDKGGHELQRMQGAGSVIPGPNASLSFMSVLVDLTTCTYRVIVEVAIDLTWTLGGTRTPIPPGSARIAVGAKRLSSGGGQTTFPIVTDAEFPGQSNAYDVGHPNDDAFMPHGIVSQLVIRAGLGGLGKADVSYGITPVRP